MKCRVCPTCGHPLPDLEVMLDLTRMQQKLFVIVKRALRAGIAANDIMECLYANEMAPDSSNILSVMKQGIAPKIAKYGLKITLCRGPGALWRLEPIHVV